MTYHNNQKDTLRRCWICFDRIVWLWIKWNTDLRSQEKKLELWVWSFWRQLKLYIGIWMNLLAENLRLWVFSIFTWRYIFFTDTIIAILNFCDKWRDVQVIKVHDSRVGYIWDYFVPNVMLMSSTLFNNKQNLSYCIQKNNITWDNYNGFQLITARILNAFIWRLLH